MNEYTMTHPDHSVELSLGQFHKLMTFFDEVGLSGQGNSAVYEFVYKNDHAYVELDNGHIYRFKVNFSQ